MILFIFFALPVATILLSIVLQRILKSPILVGITFFAIYLIIAFALFPSALAEAIIATIIYSLLAFFTAFIVSVIERILKRIRRSQCNYDTSCCCRQEDDSENDSNNLLRISYNCGNGQSNDLLTVNSSCSGSDSSNSNGNTSTCSCNSNTRGNEVAIAANFTPTATNETAGATRGSYRRM